jgi:uncharacterized protein (TIGR00269 family)
LKGVTGALEIARGKNAQRAWDSRERGWEVGWMKGREELRACRHCGREPAQYLRAVSGEGLCLKCLFASVERTVAKTIRRHKMIVPGDSVAVAVSGGKDSLVLLYMLGKFARRGLLRGVRVEAFVLDEGHEYSAARMRRVSAARELAESFGFEFGVYRFQDIFGATAAELYERLARSGYNVGMCTIDGVLRRRAMDVVGRARGWTKIALAHNLDDEAQTTLLNVLAGGLQRFYRRRGEPEEPGAIPRVKPLMYVREEETALYAYYHGLPLMEVECPYIVRNPRYDIKFFLAELERKMPHVKYALVSFGERLARELREPRASARAMKCKYCGLASSGSVCRACELFERAGLLDRYLSALREAGAAAGRA